MNRYFNQRPILAGLLATAAGAAAITGAGLAWAGPALHGLHGHSATADPAVIEAHFDKLFTEILPDGTPKQRAQLKVIAHSVHTDLGTFHAQFRTAHKRAHVLLMQSTVDRAGLEVLRQEQMQQADRVSQRIVRGLADAADVLTPAQRVRLAAHLAARNTGAGL
ncbi:periplasmic heavy metal sensor [Sphingomonas sp. RB3P16]|uniref:periplasmic heavy metal sensor n=1 Tax=Parasphingomonas frigoris TaxID=3096163 RepID=UPI002FCB099B